MTEKEWSDCYIRVKVDLGGSISAIMTDSLSS
jgi:hypothetical protein